MATLRETLDVKVRADLLFWADQILIMEQFGLSCAEVDAAAFDAGYLPARYQRNRSMISLEQQRRLFASRVAVIGCGGLGGYVIEELARLGVGAIVAIDPDVFEDHNLNRQILSEPGNLGLPKVDAASRRVTGINPGVELIAFQECFDLQNASRLLDGCDVVVDAVDNVQARLDLAAACGELNIPLVHGAIAGWYGHVCTQLPGDRTLENIYRNWSGGKGVEARLGNPSFTPAVVASFEVAEVCKVLLQLEPLLQNRILSINLLDMEVQEIPFEGESSK